MKKFVLVLAIAMIVSGTVWAQLGPTPGEPTPELTWTAAPSLQYLNATNKGVLPRFSAVPTTSIESRYSMGRFGSDVDDYIDTVWHNAQIGTFIFAGGFPGGVTPTTDPLTAVVRDGDKDALSLGFGKTIGEDKYLGIYYGGYLFDTYGTHDFYNDKEHSSDPDNKDFNHSQTRWRNKLAVLFGMPSLGGIRLDLIMSNTTSTRNTVGGELAYEQVIGAPEIDLSWGKLMGKFAPYLTLGFKFPDITTFTNADLDTAPDKKVTEASDAKLGLKAGVWLETGETTSVVAELMIGGTLPTTYKGDVKDVAHWGSGASSTDEWETGGAFAADLHVHLQKELTFGDVTVKLRPRLGINYISQSNNTTVNGTTDKEPSNDWFTLGTGLDLGVRYVYDKIALYTGAGLNFFRWQTYSKLGGDEERKDSMSRFTGIDWDSTSVTTTPSVGTLGFGLTFAPIQGLVLGTGITLASINPVTMQITPGAQPNPGATTGQAGYALWGNTALNITLSYAFK